MNKKKVLPVLLLLFLVSGALATAHGFSNPGYGGYYVFNLDSPQEVLSGFVAPFLLVTLIFQIGYKKALSFTLADEPTNQWPSPEEDKERARIKKYSLIMSLSTTGIIVPTPWFQLIRQWVAGVFGMIGFLFFGAIFAAFILMLWKAFS